MIVRLARSLSSDVALIGRGAILWDDWEDAADEDDGPPPWWARARCHEYGQDTEDEAAYMRHWRQRVRNL